MDKILDTQKRNWGHIVTYKKLGTYKINQVRFPLPHKLEESFCCKSVVFVKLDVEHDGRLAWLQLNSTPVIFCDHPLTLYLQSFCGLSV